MKKLVWFIWFSFVPVFVVAQQHGLDYYIEQAKANSPLINKNKNERKLAGLNLEQVNSILKKPMVNLEANVLFAPIVSHDNGNTRFEWVSDGADDYVGYDQAFSDGGQYQAYVTVEQPLFTGSVYKSYADKADLTKQINQNNINLTNHEIEQLVSHQYLLCLKSKKQSEISLELLNKMKQQVDIMTNLIKNAIYKRTDLLLLQIEYQNFELQHKTFETEYRNSLYDLNLLCGVDDTALVNLPDLELSVKPDTVVQSGFLTGYSLDSLSVINNRMLFEQKYKPRVSLFATAGMGAIYLPDVKRFGFSTGVNFSWNLFDGHQKQIQSKMAMVRLQTIEFEKQNFIKQYNINKHKYLNRINALDEQIAITQQQLKDYENLFKLYKQELSLAEISSMDLKNLIKDVSAKKQENLLLKMEKEILINSYNYWNY